MTTLPDPITTAHARSVALVRHVARADHEATNVLLAELAGDPVALLVQARSLAQLAVLMQPRGTDLDPVLDEMALLLAGLDTRGPDDTPGPGAGRQGR